jgi:Concanavalin A-like lectin/glucanases superfamily/Secretion system C-terminal sorting domain
MLRNISAIILLCSGLSIAQINENLLLYYSFDGNANDLSGNDYHGAPNGVSYGDDRFGNPNSAVLFDGIDDFIDFPNQTALKPQFPLSFSFWIKYESNSVNDRAVFDTSFQDDFSSGVWFNSQSSSGRHAVNHGDGSPFYNSSSRRTYVSNEEIEISVWRHVAVVIRSSTDMEIYINCKNFGGEHSGSGGNLEYASSSGSLGRHDRDLGAAPLYFKGSLDDFRYWDRAITISEIIELCDPSLGITDLSEESVKIYPNPAMDVVNIESTNIDFNTYKIYNITGQVLRNENYTSTIYIDGFSEGVYYLQLIAGNTVLTKKILISR